MNERLWYKYKLYIHENIIRYFKYKKKITMCEQQKISCECWYCIPRGCTNGRSLLGYLTNVEERMNDVIHGEVCTCILWNMSLSAFSNKSETVRFIHELCLNSQISPNAETVDKLFNLDQQTTLILNTQDTAIKRLSTARNTAKYLSYRICRYRASLSLARL